MDNEPNIKALMNAAFISESAAKAIVSRLEQAGFAIYKKKITRNGRRPANSRKMTDELAQNMRDYYGRNPDATQQQIASVFNVNIGRVNEALMEARND